MLVWGAWAWGRGKESSRGLEAARDREDMFGRAEAMVEGRREGAWWGWCLLLIWDRSSC